MSELEMPESWAHGRLEDLCNRIQYGATASAKNKGPCKFLRITDITDTGVAWESVPHCDLPANDVAKYLLSDGDVVIARTGGTVGKSFQVLGIPDEPIVFASYLIRLSLCAPLRSGSYLTLFLKSPNYWRFITDSARGAAQPNVNATILGGIDVPIPPLDEQRRIVAKIESTFNRIEAIGKAVESAELLLTKYRESLLNKAFRGELVQQDPKDEPASKLLERIRAERAKQQDGKKKKKDALPPITEDEIPFEIPKSWEWVRLGELVYLQNGFSFKQSEWAKSGLPIIRIQNLNRNGGGDFNYFNGSPQAAWTVHTGDLLFAWSGSKGVSFGAHFWNGPTSVLNQHIFKVSLPNGIAKTYMYWLLQQFQTQIEDYAHGFKETFVHVKQSDLKLVMVPLPPANEQVRVSRSLESHLGRLSSLQGQVADYGHLRDGLKEAVLSSAFSGRLVPQDPSDGTGHQLLEQILAAKTESDTAKVNSKDTAAKPKPRKSKK